MTNEEYLLISYFTAGLISLGFAIFAYLYLRYGFVEIMQSVSGKHLFQIFRKLFLIGIVLPALFGFFSVSFRSCSRDTYDKIIAERAYLFAKNQEQHFGSKGQPYVSPGDRSPKKQSRVPTGRPSWLR